MEATRSGGELGISDGARMPASTMGHRARRTSALIAEKAREVFLAKGYYGTSIDDIVGAAGVSRASFYTYYPGKRDLLVKLGNDTYVAMGQMLEEMERLVGPDGPDDAVAAVVARYLEMLEAHGAFVLVWGEAGSKDEELRRAGMRVKMATSRRLGRILMSLGPLPAGRDAGLVSMAFEVMMDRCWYYYRFADLPVTWAEMVDTLSDIVRASLGELRD